MSYEKIIRAVVVSLLIQGMTHAATEQQRFASPKAAVDALVAAIRQPDTRIKLLEIFGPSVKALLESGDERLDQTKRERFLKAFEQENKLETESDGRMTLVVGATKWQFPFPLVKENDAWIFDIEAGKQEMLDRQIGRNELSTVQAVLAYVDAQREYFLNNPAKDNVRHYAQKFMSSPGARDGLYYPVEEGEQQSPLGELFAKMHLAMEQQNTDPDDAGQRSYFGYHYRILTSQGPSAPDGAYSYVKNNRMTDGHALVAWPARYGESGIMTFLVNHDGIVYEKDLGPTNDVAQEMVSFDPDKTWKRVQTKPNQEASNQEQTRSTDNE